MFSTHNFRQLEQYFVRVSFLRVFVPLIVFFIVLVPQAHAQINAGDVYLPDTTKPSTVNGTGEPGAVVTLNVYDGAEVVFSATTTVDNQGEWSVDLPAFAEPPTNITADSEIEWTPQKVVETVTVTTAAVTSSIVLIQLVGERIFRLLQFFGLLGHRKTKGYVFDVVTKKPIPFALMTIESVGQSASKIQETVVSAVDGLFKSITLPPGMYTVTAAHPNFTFPVKGHRPWYAAPLEYYQGQAITVTSQKEMDIIFIPMLPKEGGAPSRVYWLNIHVIGGLLAQAAKVLSLPMGVVSVILVFLFPSFINFLVMSLYLLIGAQILFRRLENKSLKGKITGNKNEPLKDVVVRAYRITPDELAAVTVTNRKGEFRFHLPKNQYRVLISKVGWVPEDTKGGLSYEVINLQQSKTDLVYQLQAVGAQTI